MPKLQLLNRFIYLSLSCALLGACGTKGPLYIPEQRYPQQQTPESAPKSQANPAQNAPQ